MLRRLGLRVVPAADAVEHACLDRTTGTLRVGAEVRGDGALELGLTDFAAAAGELLRRDVYRPAIR